MNPDLLSQLRDIHSAPAAPWWPPAPGWWILALLLLLVCAWLARRLLLGLRDRKRRKSMLAWVDHLNAHTDPGVEPQAYLSTLNRIFKLVALRAFPDRHCAMMAGPEWASFVMHKMEGAPSVESLEVLAFGPYDPSPSFDAGTLSELSRTWIKRYG
jgi:hypothetical protein